MCRYDYNTIQWQPHLNSRMPFILPRCAGALVLSTSSSRCLPFLPIHSENFHSSTEKNNIDIMINRNTFVFFYWMHISGETVRAGGRNSNVQSYSILLLLKFARSSTLFVLISRFFTHEWETLTPAVFLDLQHTQTRYTRADGSLIDFILYVYVAEMRRKKY